MGQTIRFGVTLDSDLLEKFDALCEERCYQTRSEAIRDLIRAALVEETTAQGEAQAVGALSLVYNHHHSDLAQKLTELQHDVHDLIITSLHIHLDHDNCLEVLILRGKSADIRALAQRILAVKGVQHGQLALSAVEEQGE